MRVPISGEIRTGKVILCKCELYGTLRGKENDKSMLDTRIYDIEFPNGRSDEYTNNVIAKNVYAQCDEEGNEFNLMDIIVDHKTDGHDVEQAGVYIKHGSNTQVRDTTNGWNLCVECKDSTTSWEFMADLKEDIPIEVAEYAVSNNLNDPLAFVWWAPHVLNKRSHSISDVRLAYT
jgi:hypothetical protein